MNTAIRIQPTRSATGASDPAPARQKIRSTASLLAAVALILGNSIPIVAQHAAQNPGVVPINAHFGGLTYSQWLEAEWLWAVSIPVPENPDIIGNESLIANGQSGPLWFLPAPVDFSGPVTRHFNVPAGKALYVTLISVEVDNIPCPDPLDFTVDQLEAFAKELIDAVTIVEATVDGVTIQDVEQYRAATGAFSATVPENNVLQLGCPLEVGFVSPMVANGYALILTPLPVGQHTIKIHIEIPAADIFQDIADEIAITPDGN